MIISPLSAVRLTTSRMAFCSFSTCDMRTGPRLARSSRRMSAARCDMFLRNFAQRLLGAFQRNQQRLAFHFLQQALDTAIVDLHRVFEQEHLVDDLLRQLAVVFAHRVDDRFFLLGFHQVDDLGGGAHPAHFAALEVLAVEQIVQHFGQLRQRRRLYAAEGGDTQHHVVAQAFVEQGGISAARRV